MKIYFVRHGHPDYATNTLTPLGHAQAEKAALRLKDSGIEQVFSSTMGRAWQTAEYTAKQLGLEIIPCEFMRELSWGPVDDEPLFEDGHPWKVTARYITEGKTLCDRDWRSSEPFCKNKFLDTTSNLINGLDTLLEGLGYKREGEYYRVTREDTCRSIAIFSHGTASVTAFSHLFNIPLLQVIGLITIDFTCVTVVKLPDKYGELVAPKLFSSDAAHIETLSEEIVYGN